MKLPVSIVIPSFNRAQLLKRMLPSYIAQGCAEVIVVDDCSAPGIHEVLSPAEAEAWKRQGVKILRNPQRMQQPASRMIGVQAASKQHVFFGEDDAFLSPGHVPALYAAILSGRADAVASYWLTTASMTPDRRAVQRLPGPPSRWEEVLDVRRIGMRGWRQIETPLLVPWLHTLALIPRSLLLTHPFDTRYRGNAFREETDFYLTLHAAGARLAFVDAPPAFHYKGPLNRAGGQRGRLSIRDFIWYEVWVARNNLYFLRKHATTLAQLGRQTSPLTDTIGYMAWRATGYPGRLFWALQHQMGRTRDGSADREETTA